MFLLMGCRDHPNKDADRDAARTEHRAWVRSGGGGRASVLIGPALCDATGAAIGHRGVLDAVPEADTRAFAQGDPFAAAGLVARTGLTRLADTFQAERVPERMTRE